MSTREEKATRSMGGKLALWVFYTFCVYFIWVDGALRLADIRHTSRACSRPKWRASQRNGKVA
ncbi:membrane protein [Salmonella enterica subsp. arizonae]|uniref:Membrane protein n=1 Tax=Salmonella enterica subsp. arizonae TaxID=59203 RepID=A0A379T942_SALER|nr:membrane protein [Salmonella enterica subsp. arizonae]